MAGIHKRHHLNEVESSNKASEQHAGKDGKRIAKAQGNIVKNSPKPFDKADEEMDLRKSNNPKDNYY